MQVKFSLKGSPLFKTPKINTDILIPDFLRTKNRSGIMNNHSCGCLMHFLQISNELKHAIFSFIEDEERHYIASKELYESELERLVFSLASVEDKSIATKAWVNFYKRFFMHIKNTLLLHNKASDSQKTTLKMFIKKYEKASNNQITPEIEIKINALLMMANAWLNTPVVERTVAVAYFNKLASLPGFRADGLLGLFPLFTPQQIDAIINNSINQLTMTKQDQVDAHKIRPIWLLLSPHLTTTHLAGLIFKLTCTDSAAYHQYFTSKDPAIQDSHRAICYVLSILTNHPLLDSGRDYLIIKNFRSGIALSGLPVQMISPFMSMRVLAMGILCSRIEMKKAYNQDHQCEIDAFSALVASNAPESNKQLLEHLLSQLSNSTKLSFTIHMLIHVMDACPAIINDNDLKTLMTTYNDLGYQFDHLHLKLNIAWLIKKLTPRRPDLLSRLKNIMTVDDGIDYDTKQSVKNITPILLVDWKSYDFQNVQSGHLKEFFKHLNQDYFSKRISTDDHRQVIHNLVKARPDLFGENILKELLRYIKKNPWPRMYVIKHLLQKREDLLENAYMEKNIGVLLNKFNHYMDIGIYLFEFLINSKGINRFQIQHVKQLLSLIDKHTHQFTISYHCHILYLLAIKRADLFDETCIRGIYHRIQTQQRGYLLSPVFITLSHRTPFTNQIHTGFLSPELLLYALNITPENDTSQAHTEAHAPMNSEEFLRTFDKALMALKIKTNELILKGRRDYFAHDPRYIAVSEAAQILNQALDDARRNLGNQPTAERLELFKTTCKQAILKADEQFRCHRHFWGTLHPLIRYILGFLATVTIVPAVVIECTIKQGYKGVFFLAPTDSSEKLRLFSQIFETAEPKLST